MPDTVTLTNGEGHAIDIPIAEVGPWLARGYQQETPEDAAAREAQERYAARDPGIATSLIMGGLRGATFGGSDVAVRALGGEEGAQQLHDIREYHPIASTIGQIGGGLVPLSALGMGARIAELGEGAGVLGRAAADAGGAALEGSAANAGGYISDVALGDRKLSADGFIGAMGQGALWGGVAGGALSLASSGLSAARRLFPREAMTAEAIQTAEHEAAEHITIALNEADELGAATKRLLRQIRETKVVEKPDLAAELENTLKDINQYRVANEAPAAVEPEILKVKGRTARAAFSEQDVPAEALAASRFPGLGEEPPPWQTGDVGGMISRGKLAKGTAPEDLEDALNRTLAKYDPEAEKIVIAEDKLRQSREMMDRWTGRYVSKGKPEIKFSPEELAGIEAATPGRVTGDQILGAEAPKPTLDETIGKVLKRSTPDINENIAESAKTITQFEADHANLTEVLGNEAPPSSQARAAAFRDAQRAAESKVAEASAQVGQDMERFGDKIRPHIKGNGGADEYAGVPTSGGATTLGGEVAAPAAKKGGIMGALGKLGDITEALHLVGIHVPNPANIPVIGPLLSSWLKARVLSKAFGRFGGKVAETAETTIASKAASQTNRINTAIGSMLDGSSKITSKTAASVGSPAAILAHKLFDDGQPETKPYSSTPKKVEDIGQLYLARADELSRSMQPGAVAQAVRARIQTSDPEILAEVIATQERKLKYAYDKMPRPDAPPVLGEKIWIPSKAELAGWSKVIGALEDPAGVIERAAHGAVVSPEEIDAIKSVYPSQYFAGQKRVITESINPDMTTTYQMRVRLSRLWGVPMDASMRPEYAAFLQGSYQAQPPAPQPTAQPGQPMISGPMNIGQRTMTRLDQG